jgi:hypothetical protein
MLPDDRPSFWLRSHLAALGQSAFFLHGPLGRREGLEALIRIGSRLSIERPYAPVASRCSARSKPTSMSGDSHRDAVRYRRA